MMKRSINKHIALVGVVILSVACSTELHVPAPSFEVHGYEVEKTMDTLDNEVFQVLFQLSGDPDIISFYSGQVGNDYQYRDGRLLGYEALNLSFNTNVQYGTQENQFSVWVSSNFNGDYTFESVTGADWANITDGFALGTGAPFVPSGVKDIREYQVEGKPLYIAFKYVYGARSIAGVPNQWRVNNFNLSGVTAIGNLTIADQQSGAWSFVNNYIDDPISRTRIEGNGNIFLANGNNDGSEEVPGEAWCVSKGLELDAIDNGPDRAIPIKRIIDPAPVVYQYNYPQSGTYEVVFIAKNVTGDDEKQVFKTIQVTIP